MSLDKVRASLESNIKYALPSGYEVAFENTDFDVPSEPWAEVFFLPGPISVASLGDNGQDRVDGLIQVDLNFKPGEGTMTAFTRFEALRTQFKAGTSFTYDGQAVTILSCSRSPGRVSRGWYTVSVSIFWYAFLDRS